MLNIYGEAFLFLWIVVPYKKNSVSPYFVLTVGKFNTVMLDDLCRQWLGV